MVETRGGNVGGPPAKKIKAGASASKEGGVEGDHGSCSGEEGEKKTTKEREGRVPLEEQEASEQEGLPGGSKLSPGEVVSGSGGAGGTASGGGLGAFASKTVREALEEKGKTRRLVVVVFNMRESKSGGLTCTAMDFMGSGECYTLVGTKESLAEWEGKGIKDANVLELKLVDVWSKGGGKPVITFSRGETTKGLVAFSGSVGCLAPNAGPRHWSGMEVFEGEGKWFVSCVVGRLERVEEEKGDLWVWIAGPGGEARIFVEGKRAAYKEYLIGLEKKVVEVWGVEKVGVMSGRTQGWDYLIRELPVGKVTEVKYREMEEWMAREEGEVEEEEDEVTKKLRAEMGGE